MLKSFLKHIAAGALVLSATATYAQDFPSKPITWIVPYTPGGITDTRSRLIADEFGKALGGTVIVENKPGEVTVGLAGIGTGTHLASELFANAAGIEFLQVPYKGSAPMLNDLIAGRLDIAFDYAVSTAGHVKSGSVKVLGVTSEQRLDLFPDAKTMIEAGIPEATTGSWSGIMAPAGTPPERIKILTDAFDTAMKSAPVVEAMARVQSQMVDMDGAEMGAFIAAERDRWSMIIEKAGIEKR